MSGVPGSADLHIAVHGLLETYGRLLDEDRLEDWVELFADETRYEIVSRENREQNLPLSLILCDSKDMIHDRVMSLREANIYNLHHDCHIIGLFHVDTADGIAVTAPYSLFQSTPEGDSRLFSVGRYHLDLVETAQGLRIARQIVVVDTGTIPTLLATPI